MNGIAVTVTGWRLNAGSFLPASVVRNSSGLGLIGLVGARRRAG